MRRSTRSPSIPNIVARPVLKASPPKPTPASMWKEFEKAPEQQRIVFANRVASHVSEMKEELAIQEAASRRSAELDHILSQLQMKFGMVYEQFTLNQTLANSADEISELFAVDISSRTRDVSCLGLPPVAEAHVATALQEWQAKVERTTWYKSVNEALAEEAELLARRDELRASIEDKKRQIEAVNRIKREERMNDCKSRAEAETLLNFAMSQVSVRDEDDLESEADPSIRSLASCCRSVAALRLSTPPGSPAPSVHHDVPSDSDQEEDDFLDTI